MNVLKSKLEYEISKVLGGLGNPFFNRFTQPMVDKVLFIHNSILTRSKYFCVNKLVSLVIYVFLTLRDVKVNKLDLIRVSEIFYQEFNCFFRQLKDYLLKYYQGDNYV